MKNSLVSLAKKKRLPDVQRMDKETLEWIRANEPIFKTAKKIILPPRFFMEQFVPPADWFLKKRHTDSIHGVRHLLRVGINIVIAARIFSFKENIETLLVAGILHDVRRENDKADPSHGLRAARWFRQNRTIVGRRCRLRFTRSDVEKIYWSIVFHELPRSEIIKDRRYLEYKQYIDIVRMADALDRYRLPKLKWWINDEILGMNTPDVAKKTAYDLVIRSEEFFLRGNTSKESVLNILPAK
ncbi:MAG: hypothetical protein A2934_03840 [Candidatus Sungbacteria bacterium RIFCSPLOWO2_01_FULL_47_10]|uniref:HD/PDEase domain-containing protein n=1 Tax=Candidatus Sungbacteria bacterium RIFCSPLOWO2_01_FULL_47_10 TaxID=1802276 RepID=A0A1G2L565_9BACT|nr:MAG: hypothetical protein A2934_03840 [Candidatus Sungbacteria bacterium RIFCSPLOWO2_01_FULL_47_10]